MELNERVRNCQGADSLRREFNLVERDTKDEETGEVDLYENGTYSKRIKLQKDKCGSEKLPKRNCSAMTDVHIRAAKQLGVMMLEYDGLKNTAGKKSKALELDLQAFHQVRIDKTYYTMESNKKVNVVYRLPH